MRFAWIIAGCTLAAGSAMAQQALPVPGPLNLLPYYNPGGNTINPATGRPALSPYLNLLNGSNPALNYYYGVRPLLPQSNAMSAIPQAAPALGRLPFTVPTPAVRDPFEPEDPKAFRLPSPGGAVSYGNFFGSSRAGVAGNGSSFTRPAPSGTGSSGSGRTAPNSIPKSR